MARSRDDTWDALAYSTYRNGGVNLNHLKDMDAYIRGGDGTGYSRVQMSNYGAPDFNLNPYATNESYDQVDLNVDILSLGGYSSCEVYFEYWEGTTTRDNASTVYTTGSITVGSTGTATVTATGLNESQQYTFNAVVYNKFTNLNNGANPFGRSNTATFSTTAFTLSTPQIQSFTTTQLYGDVSWSDNNGVLADDYEIRYRVNSGTWETGGSVTNRVNWGTSSNPKSARKNYVSRLSSGDVVDIEVRAYNSQYSTYSNWSNYATDTVP